MTRHPLSDHCDGSRFFNPLDPTGHGFASAMKMLLTMRFEKWPKWVANSPALELDHKLEADEAAITFVNHATVLVQTQGFAFLTDPVWSARVSPLSWLGPKRHRPPGIPFNQLPKIDFVLISHNHYDHMDLVTLRRLHECHHPRFLVPLGNQKFLERNGITKVVELDWWQSLELTPNLKIALAPAVHFSSRSPFDRNKTLWGSYVISFGGHTLYFGADSAYSPHFKTIRERFGSPDIAFLPIGAYEPRWFMKAVHMNPEEAVQAHEDLGSRQSIGIHLGTFQLTGEAMDQPAKDLVAALDQKNIPRPAFAILGEGQTRAFKFKPMRGRAVPAPSDKNQDRS